MKESFRAENFALPFQRNAQSVHITARRDTITTGTITAMTMVDLVFFLFEQYVSLIFEHTGLPSNLVTPLHNR